MLSFVVVLLLCFVVCTGGGFIFFSNFPWQLLYVFIERGRVQHFGPGERSRMVQLVFSRLSRGGFSLRRGERVLSRVDAREARQSDDDDGHTEEKWRRCFVASSSSSSSSSSLYSFPHREDDDDDDDGDDCFVATTISSMMMMLLNPPPTMDE